MGSASWKRRMAVVGASLAVAVTAAACSSTTSSTSTTSSGGSGSSSSKIPSSAFSDHTGITSSSITVGNVSWAQIFKGAGIGAQAYFASVNAAGGVNGRTIKVATADDGNSGASNKQLTQNAINQDFALVGDFSLQDGYGGALLKENPGMPDVSVVEDPTTNALPNVFSPVPLNDGWEEGPLEYFYKKYKNLADATGSVVADLPASQAAWTGEKYALEHVGFKVIYDQTYAETQFDFTQDVVAMKNAGVKILFIDQLPTEYAPSLLKALNQQNFHPVVVLGAATYANSIASLPGVNGDYLQQNASLYLSTLLNQEPASVATFQKWVAKTDPGFSPDLFTLYGWVSAELFTQALQNAGKDPSRGSLLQALSKITSFDGQHIIAPTNPAAKTLGNCYVIGQVEGGKFQRLDDPAVTSSTNGYRCDYAYISPPKS